MPLFDFEAAVTAPFRMQPGLRRLAVGQSHLTPLLPGSPHQREKLAVLSAYAPKALCSAADFSAGSAATALAALCNHAAAERPGAWIWDGHCARAARSGTAVTTGGDVEQFATGVFGLGDEVTRCLLTLPPTWRLAGLLSLTFAEDFALVDANSGRVPWLAVCLPSHWAPEDKVGRHFTEIHAAVADNQMLLKASDSLLRLISGPDRWERFVWNVTDEPRLHAHPDHCARQRWPGGAIDRAWLRSERQTFIPFCGERGHQHVWFTIGVDVVALGDMVAQPGRAAALHAAIASMTPAVLAYRGLTTVQGALLAWLERHTAKHG
jgi:hypothetical protein